MDTYHVRIESPDGRLGRNVKHDPRSLAFPFTAKTGALTKVSWTPLAPVFDQGDIGSCTGNAALTAVSCGPFLSGLPDGEHTARAFRENDCVKLYSDATRLDDFQGNYPPTDTGSDGLSVAKVLHERGWISGYRHVLSGAQGIAQALMEGPVTVGVGWYRSFYEPSPTGEIGIRSGDRLEGGHQICFTGYDPETDLFTFRNSWGVSWGRKGFADMSGRTLDHLMSELGDATVFTPASEPAPKPIEDVALAKLVGKIDPWLSRRVPAFGAGEARDHIRAYLRSVGAI